MLIIDADATVRRGLARALVERDMEPVTAEDAAAGMSLLASHPPDAVLMEGTPGGLEAAASIAASHPQVGLIVLADERRRLAALDAAWSIGADLLA
ncbi:MAG: hypothetical protein R2939_00050, partial [Kofleriaceae bacterium]